MLVAFDQGQGDRFQFVSHKLYFKSDSSSQSDKLSQVFCQLAIKYFWVLSSFSKIM